jgi:hypothetical protein
LDRACKNVIHAIIPDALHRDDKLQKQQYKRHYTIFGGKILGIGNG